MVFCLKDCSDQLWGKMFYWLTLTGPWLDVSVMDQGGGGQAKMSSLVNADSFDSNFTKTTFQKILVLPQGLLEQMMGM